MPIYEDAMPRDDMLRATFSHQCGECGGRLTFAWSAERSCYMLRCRELSHHTINRYRTLSPEEIEGRKIFRGGEVYMQSEALTKLPPEKMLARVNHVRWPRDLTKQEALFIAQVALEYGLDPLFGELMLYQGKPYVTIAARRRKAQETGQLDGISSRPGTPAEREGWGAGEGDYLFFADVRVKACGQPFTGHGLVCKLEIERARAQATVKGHQPDALPIVKDPAGMAEKRAECQALRRAFSLPLPSAEDIFDAEFTVATLPTPPAAAAAATATPASKECLNQPSKYAAPAQKRKIIADAVQAGWREDELALVINRKWQLSTLDELTVPQASELINMIARGETVPVAEPESHTDEEVSNAD